MAQTPTNHLPLIGIHQAGKQWIEFCGSTTVNIAMVSNVCEQLGRGKTTFRTKEMLYTRNLTMQGNWSFCMAEVAEISIQVELQVLQTTNSNRVAKKLADRVNQDILFHSQVE